MMNHSLLALSLCAAVVYGAMIPSKPNFARMAFKTTSIGLLSVQSALVGSPPLLVAAQAFGAAGDAFLAWDGDAAFLGGLGNFMVAHILYVKLFLQIGGGRDRLWSEDWRKYIAGVTSLLALVMATILTPRVGRDLRVPVLMYSVVILFMVLTSLTMERTQTILGAILFTTSDALLASEKFLVSDTSRHRGWMQYAVWLLYYSGQFLIMTGIVSN